MVYGNKEMIEVLFMLKVEPTMFVELVFWGGDPTWAYFDKYIS